MCCQGDTNKGNRYAGKLVGDTPECMPLDSNLFSDYSVAIRHHIAATCELDYDDLNRFNVGTTAELGRTMLRVWQISPSPLRIVHDIRRFHTALERIIECKGARVPDLDHRTGRRATAAARVYHSDCDGAFAAQKVKFARLDPVA